MKIAGIILLAIAIVGAGVTVWLSWHLGIAKTLIIIAGWICVGLFGVGLIEKGLDKYDE